MGKDINIKKPRRKHADYIKQWLDSTATLLQGKNCGEHV
jgi:hypothetical protein